MTTDTAIEDSGLLLGEGWRDRIEAGVRGRIRGFIEEMLEAELLQALGRERYVRLKITSGAAVARSEGLGDEEAARGVTVVPAKGHRHGNRERELMGTSVRSRSPCRAPGSTPATAKRPSGRTRRCRPIDGARRRSKL